MTWRFALHFLRLSWLCYFVRSQKSRVHSLDDKCFAENIDPFAFLSLTHIARHSGAKVDKGLIIKRWLMSIRVASVGELCATTIHSFCLRHGVATRAAHSLFNKFAAGERRVSSQFVPELLQCRTFAPLPGHLSHPLKITISDNCPGTLKMRDIKMRETR